MKRVVREYHIKPGESKFVVPFGSKILSFCMDRGIPTISVLINGDVEIKQTVYTLVHETDVQICEMVDFYNFLGSFRDDDGLAWHCFYLRNTKQ